MSEYSIDKSRTTYIVLAVALIILLGRWILSAALVEPTGSKSPSEKIQSSLDRAKTGEIRDGGFHKTHAASIKDGAIPMQSGEDVQAQQNAELAQFAEAAGIDVSEAIEMKSAYFCDLAVKTRERCEKIPRNSDQMEFCLKAGGYYTNSRYCGSRP